MPSPDDHLEQPPKRSFKIITCLIPTGLMICLACFMSIVAVNWYATTSPRAGLPVTICLGMTTTPRVQVGIAGQSLLSSYMSPLTNSPLAVCTHVPHAWLSPTLHRHSWEFLWPP